ncbi:type III-B CRISPR module-associated Cmr3 family protein [Thermocrinis sp.]|uniref:type III-B CRISPR module-associated Cmr3 family protein n=1 Tax=Thermocrinis sp. TaxID=2024383 RepID=UPI002FDC9BBA
MKLLELTPEDALTFGSLKNFTAGESHYQQVSFPPPIMRFFSLGDGAALRVMGVFIKHKGELFLPMPADCLSMRKKEEGKVYVPKWSEELKRPFVVPFEGQGLLSLEQAKGFCSFSNFAESYAKGKGFSTKKEILFQEEERVGVKLNYDKRVSQEGYLYSRVYLRFKDSHIVLLVDQDVEKSFFATVGGERKYAKVKPVEDRFLDFLNSTVSIEKGGLYKFYSTTHLYVDLKGEIWLSEHIKFKVEWVSSLEPEWVSGFAKPFLYMLRPGTVLWLRALESGMCKRLCQISSHKEVIKYGNESKDLLKRGWNSGILLEVA